MQTVEEILEGDYQFVLVSGDYFDCPSCNPGASLGAKTFYDEEALLNYILSNVGSDRMETIWVIDSYGNGDMAKYCNIKTKTSWHNVARLEFTLPITGPVIIMKDKDGKWIIADKEYTILYAQGYITEDE